MPLCLIALPKVAVSTLHPAPPAALAKAPAGPVFWLLDIEGMVLSLISTIVSVHLIVLLQAQGVPLAAAVALGALIGPAQVGARMIEMATGGRHPAIWTLLTATALIAAGVAGMQAGLPMAAALIVYGAGNGLWSIARGAVPLALFGADRYPLATGRLAQPALLSAAIAPSLGAVLIDWLGTDQTFVFLAAASLVPLCCSLALLGVVRRGRAAQDFPA